MLSPASSPPRSRWRILMRAILARYFDIVPVPPSFSALAAQPNNFVIVAQSDSVVIESLLYSLARRTGAGDISYPSERDSDGLLWTSVHDENALTTIITLHPERRFATLNLFHVRGPARNNPSNRMNFVRQLGVILGGRLMFIIFGQPLTPAGATTHTQLGPVALTKRLARELKVDFYQNLKLIRGTPYQSIDTQARSILGGHEFERELRTVAQRQNQPVSRVRDRARREFYQIAANPRRTMYGIIAPCANFIINRLFNQVVTTGWDRVTPAVREHAVVVVPMHRSHLDYILLGAKFYESNLNPPLVAAGINLGFWPVGPIIRSVGAYFVRRDARQDRIHAIILRRYVTYLVKRGHLQEFFIEGGRSRTGRMRPPKVGLLSIMIDAYLRRERRDVLFVPASITYETLIEEKSFGEENTGQLKIKENFFSLLSARKIFRKRYGEVILNFGTPISLAEFIGAQQRGDAAPSREGRNIAVALGQYITRRIRAQTHVSLASLTYSALLMAPHYGVPRGELVSTIRNLGRVAALLAAARPELGGLTSSLRTFLDGKDHILNDMLHGGVVASGEVLGESIFYIPGKRRYTADFYKNSSLHVFFATALLAIAELIDGEVAVERAAQFHPIFEHDFMLPPAAEFQAELSATVEILQRGGILSAGPEPVKFLDRSPGFFVPAMLLSTLQCYRWVALHLPQQRAENEAPDAPGATIEYKHLLERLQSDFLAARYLGFMNRTEASSRATLTAVLEGLQARRIISLQEHEGKLSRVTVLRSWNEECQLLERAEIATAAWLETSGSRGLRSATRHI